MSPGSPLSYFAGFDWAKHSHQVVIVNAAGQTVAEFRFEHTEAGTATLAAASRPLCAACRRR